MSNSDNCFECEKRLKSGDYFTLARIQKPIFENSTIRHFCNLDCLKLHVSKLVEKTTKPEGEVSK